MLSCSIHVEFRAKPTLADDGRRAFRGAVAWGRREATHCCLRLKFCSRSRSILAGTTTGGGGVVPRVCCTFGVRCGFSDAARVRGIRPGVLGLGDSVVLRDLCGTAEACAPDKREEAFKIVVACNSSYRLHRPQCDIYAFATAFGLGDREVHVDGNAADHICR